MIRSRYGKGSARPPDKWNRLYEDINVGPLLRRAAALQWHTESNVVNLFWVHIAHKLMTY